MDDPLRSFTGYECNERRFSIIEGQCVNPAVPGAIPNWAGAPTYRLIEATPDLFRAPLCESSSGRKPRLYENTCRCAQGEDAVEIAFDGSIRGNCTGYVQGATIELTTPGSLYYIKSVLFKKIL